MRKYVAFYRGKSIEVWAPSSYSAQLEAAKLLKVGLKRYLITFKASMMTYYITCKRSREISKWVKAEARTLLGAKQEASRLYADDYQGSTIQVATGDGINEQRVVVACRQLAHGNWRTMT
jgi:hypothetical protein